VEIAELNSIGRAVVIDLAALTPKSEIEKEIQNGFTRCLMSRLRKLTGTISKNCVFFINQLRENWCCLKS
jgi:RecA/RadA recombinase